MNILQKDNILKYRNVIILTLSLIACFCSPCLAADSISTIVKTDIDGVKRDSTYDIGAFEYTDESSDSSSGTTTPTVEVPGAPASLQITN
jgi:hypothetical protein